MPKSKRVLEGSDLHRVIDDVTLNEAFKLAHSIYRHREADRKIALAIVREAVRGVEVRLTTQREADRHDPQKPTKVRWSTLQWLQILIYCKSEAHEKQQEANKDIPLSEEDMMIRYLKHLILATSRRNSFHITLGLSRLLYAYSAAETMAIYDLIFQDTDSSTRKADAYYRARKNKLIDELQKRFHRLVRIEQGPRGEKRFQLRDNSVQFIDPVIQYLTRFTPWETSCPLPERIDAWTTVRSLQSSQQSQIHSLIHPNCFAKITGALGLDAPESRLALPKFFLKKEPGDKTRSLDDDLPSELTQQEASEIRNEIAAQENSRKKFVPNSLSVLTDGIEHARLNLGESRRVRFDVGENATLIEVVGHSEAGELLLASHVLTREENEIGEKQASQYSVTLEGGQRITLATLLLPADDGFIFSVEVSYRETKFSRAVALWWRRLKFRLSPRLFAQGSGRIRVLSPATVIASFALIATIGLILYFAMKNRPGEYVAQQPAPAATLEPGRLPTPENSSPQQAGPTAEPSPSSTLGKFPAPGGTPKLEGKTREPSARAVTSLLQVERIYVESLGDDLFSRDVREKLIEKLQTSNRFLITKDPNEADAALSGSARRVGTAEDERARQQTEVGILTLQLVNASGENIWSAKKYRGTAEQVATQFTKALLAAIEAERRQPKK